MLQNLKRIVITILAGVSALIAIYKKGEKNGRTIIINDTLANENKLLKENLRIKKNEFKNIKDADDFIASELRQTNNSAK